MGPIGSDSRNRSFAFAPLEIREKQSVITIEFFDSDLALRSRGRTNIYPRIIKTIKASAPKTPPRIPPTKRKKKKQ